jgi:hypothetical protein
LHLIIENIMFSFPFCANHIFPVKAIFNFQRAFSKASIITTY